MRSFLILSVLDSLSLSCRMFFCLSSSIVGRQLSLLCRFVSSFFRQFCRSSSDWSGMELVERYNTLTHAEHDHVSHRTLNTLTPNTKHTLLNNSEHSLSMIFFWTSSSSLGLFFSILLRVSRRRSLRCVSVSVSSSIDRWAGEGRG